MQPNPDYLNQSQEFWANVRTISELCGYTRTEPGYSQPPEYLLPKATQKRNSSIRVPKSKEIVAAFRKKNLKSDHLVSIDGSFTEFGQTVRGYFEVRAESLEHVGAHCLMDAPQASQLLEEQNLANVGLIYPRPTNKQKAEKKAEAFLTCLVNLIVSSIVGDVPVNYDPGELTKITKDDRPLRTLSRRVDGAFPAAVDPLAIWEIKEYYYTTTFGSRVADGVYETMLDGFELREAAEIGKRPHHVLIVDSHYTWWLCGGKSYLCRIVDMLHMGLVTEVIFGREVVTEFPRLVRSWFQEHAQRNA